MESGKPQVHPLRQTHRPRPACTSPNESHHRTPHPHRTRWTPRPRQHRLRPSLLQRQQARQDSRRVSRLAEAALLSPLQTRPSSPQTGDSWAGLRFPNLHAFSRRKTRSDPSWGRGGGFSGVAGVCFLFVGCLTLWFVLCLCWLRVVCVCVWLVCLCVLVLVCCVRVFGGACHAGVVVSGVDVAVVGGCMVQPISNTGRRWPSRERNRADELQGHDQAGG